VNQIESIWITNQEALLWRSTQPSWDGGDGGYSLLAAYRRA